MFVLFFSTKYFFKSFRMILNDLQKFYLLENEPNFQLFAGMVGASDHQSSFLIVFDWDYTFLPLNHKYLLFYICWTAPSIWKSKFSPKADIGNY